LDQEKSGNLGPRVIGKIFGIFSPKQLKMAVFACITAIYTEKIIAILVF
jgi:hypothetical protein